MRSCLQSGRGAHLRSLPTLVVILVACVGIAQADNAVVKCPNQSVQTALNLMHPREQNSISIEGICTESIMIDGFRNLSLSGSAIIQPGVDGYALRIESSSQVTIDGLTFKGPGTPPGAGEWVQPLASVWESTRIQFRNCTFEGAKGDGLRLDSSREVTVGPAVIRDNFGSGMVMNGPSSATLGAWENPNPTLVEGNGLAEYPPAAVVVSNGGDLSLLQNVAIQNNLGGGVGLGGSHLSTCCDPQMPKILKNGGAGIGASGSSDVSLYGAAIEDNKGSGIDLSHSSLGTWVVSIRRNGDPAQPGTRSGISLNDTSSASVMQGSVSDNYGPGVQAMNASSLMVCCGMTMSGNSRAGVVLETNSSGSFWGTSSIAGNLGDDLLCTSGAVAVSAKGTDPGIGKMHCSEYSVLAAPDGNHSKPPKPPKQPKPKKQ